MEKIDFQHICQSVYDKPKKGAQQSLTTSDDFTFSKNKTCYKIYIRVLFQFPYTFLKANSNFLYLIDQFESDISHFLPNVLMTDKCNVLCLLPEDGNPFTQAKTLPGMTPLQRVCSFSNMNEDVVLSVRKRFVSMRICRIKHRY
jgi:hypothetical protein